MITYYTFFKNLNNLLYICFESNSLSDETKSLIISDLSDFLGKLKSYLEDSVK